MKNSLTQFLVSYAHKVIDNQIVSGDNQKKACQRFLDDLLRDDIYLREDKIVRTVKFAAMFRHYTGVHSGKRFRLTDWELFIVANIFGWYCKSTNQRRFQQSYIEIARKNGKTFLAAILCLFALLADGEDGAEVLLAANSRDQANIAFEMCKTLCRQIDPAELQIISFKHKITFTKNNSVMRVLASDDSKLDGFNASFALVDEFHQARNSRIRDVIQSSMGMRANPHLCTITTAGFNKNYPCYQLRQYGIDVLNKNAIDDSFFVCIFSLDENDDWKDPHTWQKANPNLGITVQKSFIQTQVNQAINSPSERVPVLTKNLNVWCDNAQAWIQSEYVNSVFKKVDLDFFRRSDVLTFAGVDLAAVSDLTAVALCGVSDSGEMQFYVRYFLPEDAVSNGGKNQFLYENWRDNNLLTVTPGNVTDYTFIKNWFLDLYNQGINLCSIQYDSWNSTQWAVESEQAGLPLHPYSQSIGNFNKPTKEFERRVLGGECIIDNNPINKFCLDNVVIISDINGNTKPSKNASSEKIDGVIAMVQALGGYLLN